MNIRWLLLVVALFALSCNSNGNGAGPGDRASELLEATRAHGERIAAMSDMSGIPAEEAAHAKEMDAMMGSLQHDLDRMNGACSEEVEHMEEWMKDTASECFHHNVDMLAAGSMDEAHDEEARHQARMAEMAFGMDDVEEHMMEHCMDGTGGMGGM